MAISVAHVPYSKIICEKSMSALPGLLYDTLQEMARLGGTTKIGVLRQILRKTKAARHSRALTTLAALAGPAAPFVRPVFQAQLTSLLRRLNKTHALNFTDLQAQGFTNWTFGHIPLLKAVVSQLGTKSAVNTNANLDLRRQDWDSLWKIFTDAQIAGIVNIALK